MIKILKPITLLSFLIGILILPYLVFAAGGGENTQSNSALDRLQEVGEGQGGYASAGPTTVSEIAGQVVNASFAFLGIIFIILIILGGYKWMTARGNEDQAKQGSDIIRRAIIGLIIVVGAWAISGFVLSYLIPL